MAEASQPKYILGHDQSEIDRLMVQSAVMRPFTERLFKAAGMSTGMRVLDLGCGPSDVSMLAANLVGPSGSVIGIDRSLEVISIETDAPVSLYCYVRREGASKSASTELNRMAQFPGRA